MTTLRLMAPNPLWKQEFEQTRSSILGATEGWITACQHIGSTALGSMIARPTVDAIAGVSDLSSLNDVATLIEGLNFRRLPSPDWCDDELTAYLEKPRTGEPTHSVLVTRFESVAWQNCVTARERLSTSAELRDEFETIKRANFQPGCGALQQYALSKAAFFESLLNG